MVLLLLYRGGFESIFTADNYAADVIAVAETTHEVSQPTKPHSANGGDDGDVGDSGDKDVGNRDDRASTNTAEASPMEDDSEHDAKIVVNSGDPQTTEGPDINKLEYEDCIKMYNLAKTIIEEEFETAYMDVDPPTINNFLELKKYIDVGLEHFSGADLYYLNKDSFDFSKDVSDFPPTRTVTEHELFFRILNGLLCQQTQENKVDY